MTRTLDRSTLRTTRKLRLYRAMLTRGAFGCVFCRLNLVPILDWCSQPYARVEHGFEPTQMGEGPVYCQLTINPGRTDGNTCPEIGQRDFVDASSATAFNGTLPSQSCTADGSRCLLAVQAHMAAPDIGRAIKYPCARSHPRFLRLSNVLRSSMPSAVTRSPRL